MFDPTAIKVKPLPEAAAPEPAASEATASTPLVETGPPIKEGTLPSFWRNIKDWAVKISNSTAPLKDIPEDLQKAISERYTGDAEFRENDQLIMINWLYEYIHTATEFTKEKRSDYLIALSEALLEMVWDESLRPNEQLQLLSTGDTTAYKIAKSGGQVLVKGETTSYRVVDISTGGMKYYCGKVPCSEAVSRILDTNDADPFHNIKADSSNTAPIYGFIVPKGKEGRLVFKTNERPVPPGTKPEKGGECSIVSTISFHIRMLKNIAKLIEEDGYSTFILKDEYLDEKAIKRREKREEEAAKEAGKNFEKEMIAPPIRTTQYAKKAKHVFKTRTFENAVRACALKNIILRMIDFLQVKTGGRRYFYRPVAALKSEHKGSK
jgi:hypothetical protein